MKKLQISFSSRELDIVDKLKKAAGRSSLADVVRDALDFYGWCRRQVADGFTIVAIKGDKTREIVLPFDRFGKE